MTGKEAARKAAKGAGVTGTLVLVALVAGFAGGLAAVRYEQVAKFYSDLNERFPIRKDQGTE